MEEDAHVLSIGCGSKDHVLQVYHENIFDLLEQSRKPQPIGPRPALPIKEDARGHVFVAGLTRVPSRDQTIARDLHLSLS